MQPLAPCALSLEGTVLGASQITWVGGRTVLSAIVALSFFSLVSSQGWALPGIWAGGLPAPHPLLRCFASSPLLMGGLYGTFGIGSNLHTGQVKVIPHGVGCLCTVWGPW